MVVITAAGPEHRDGLVRLFEATGSPCYCRFWHFEGTNNEWLARCAEEPDQNRRELEQGLLGREWEARGIVAIDSSNDEHEDERDHEDVSDGADDSTVIGWLKVAPVSVMKKLYDHRLYRKLPCFEGDREGIFVIGCALIHPSHRHRGVATALVGGAIRIAPAWGARALEAFPRRPKEPVRDEELWTGPMGAFTKNGFVEVNDFEPYPVLRRELQG